MLNLPRQVGNGTMSGVSVTGDSQSPAWWQLRMQKIPCKSNGPDDLLGKGVVRDGEEDDKAGGTNNMLLPPP